MSKPIRSKIYKKIDIEKKQIRTCTIFKVNNNWFCSITYRNTEDNLVEKFNNECVGVDIGITRMLQYSTREDEFYNLPSELKKLTLKKDFYNKKMHKAKKGSKNRKKYKDKLVLIHKKIADLRKIETYKEINKLAKENKVVCVEKLKIKNMTKSSKGTVEKPGKNVKAKSGLNREMLNISAYSFKERLKRKCEEFGSVVVEVDPKYTSKTCSKCQHKDKENRKTQEKFKCTSCGYETNADYNAAKNIERIGYEQYKDSIKI